MRILVTGAGGFIGHHMVKCLKKKGYYVIGADVYSPQWEITKADEFYHYDLRHRTPVLISDIDYIYHFAANMGGIGFIEAHKADIVYDNTLINLNMLKYAQAVKAKRFLFTSSACIYPSYLQSKADIYPLNEDDAYPAMAEDGYGWEKLMMERACRHFREDYGLETRIARLHNIYGPMGAYKGGREKSPAALCRKVALAKKYDDIEIWGDGTQTRSYCYIDDCIEGLYKLMQSDYYQPMNIGSDYKVTINKMADIIIGISGKTIAKKYDLTKPQGVRGRNADIRLAFKVLDWLPMTSLEDGLKETYQWISQQLSSVRQS